MEEKTYEQKHINYLTENASECCLFLKKNNTTVQGINSRIALLNGIERKFSVVIDDIVSNDDKTFDLLCQIRTNGDHKGNKQNALRLYYRFINGKDFPLLKEYPSLKVRFHIAYKNNVTIKSFSQDLISINDAVKETVRNVSGEKKYRVNDNNVKIIRLDSGSIWIEVAVFLGEVVAAFAIEQLLSRLLEKFKKKKRKYRVIIDDDGNVYIEEV